MCACFFARNIPPADAGGMRIAGSYSALGASAASAAALAAAAFICGYVRMALRGGILYATSERGEGYLA